MHEIEADRDQANESGRVGAILHGGLEPGERRGGDGGSGSAAKRPCPDLTAGIAHDPSDDHDRSFARILSTTAPVNSVVPA
jgi:hypothetical protein